MDWALLLGWVAIASLLSFALAVIDKSRARRGRGRVPERVLLGGALVGGSPGLLLGMVMARHKTRKASFLLAFVLIVLAQLASAWLFLR